MEKKEVTINVGPIRKPASILGSTLGTSFFKAEARASILDFEKKKLEIEQAGNVDLFITRNPRRFRMTDHDVVSVAIRQDATGAQKIVLNEELDSKVSIAVAPGMEKIGVVTDNALAKALKGDKSIIFANAKKLANELNTLNLDEKNRLIALQGIINNAIKQIDSAIAENNKKANDYYNELVSSTPEDKFDDNTVVLNLGNEDNIVVTE